jgi:hypothetical protein
MVHPYLLAKAINDIIAGTRDAIREAHAAECAARRKFWSGCIPTRQDLHAVDAHVAAQLKTTPEFVRETLASSD